MVNDAKDEWRKTIQSIIPKEGSTVKPVYNDIRYNDIRLLTIFSRAFNYF